VSDQSSGYVVYRLAGPAARTLLQRGAAIDLHPAAFPPRAAAVTMIAHLGVILWLADEAPTFEVAVFRSFAGSFQHWLETAGQAL
jgi:sarcosine oxidase subunit gamma